MKSLLLIFLTVNSLLASQQLLVVVADDFNTSTALLQRYGFESGQYKKAGEPVRVNIGRNGLGWGIGEIEVLHNANEPVKREGDGKAPSGIFSLDMVFGYKRHVPTAMPYLQATRDLICIDDSTSSHYNKITPINGDIIFKSFEWMKRDDDLYTLGVTVSHNRDGISQKGSCIFLHVQKGVSSPTAGCTSMTKKELGAIVNWLDPQKEPLLIQIPKKYCEEIEHRFSGVACPDP